MDIDDVAAAHCLAMVQPEANGRYVLWERACLMTEVAAMLRCAVVGAALWLGHLRPRHSELPAAAAAAHAPCTSFPANQAPILPLCASDLRRREEFPAHWVPPLSAPLWLSVPVLILSRTLK